MSISLYDLKLYGALTDPQDDILTNIGGGIDKSLKFDFTDLAAAWAIVSENGGDVSQNITLQYRDAGGNLLTEVKTLSGQSLVNGASTPERIERAVKSATCAGNVALLTQTPYYDSGSAKVAASGGYTATLDASASAVDQAYRGMIFRVKAGTGQYGLREIIDYIGSTKIATFNDTITLSSSDSTYTISNGFFFDKTPNEIMTVERPFINAIANAAGGAAKTYYQKMFYWNNHASLDLTTSQVILAANPSGDITFGVEAALDGTTTNGGGNNRQVAPAGITFDTSAKNVANSQSLTHGHAQPVWVCLNLPAGSAALKTNFTLQVQGGTV